MKTLKLSESQDGKMLIVEENGDEAVAEMLDCIPELSETQERAKKMVECYNLTLFTHQPEPKKEVKECEKAECTLKDANCLGCDYYIKPAQAEGKDTILKKAVEGKIKEDEKLNS